MNELLLAVALFAAPANADANATKMEEALSEIASTGALPDDFSLEYIRTGDHSKTIRVGADNRAHLTTVTLATSTAGAPAATTERMVGLSTMSRKHLAEALEDAKICAPHPDHAGTAVTVKVTAYGAHCELGLDEEAAGAEDGLVRIPRLIDALAPRSLRN